MYYFFKIHFLLIFLKLDSYKLIQPTNVTWHILSPNLMPLYGSFMRGVGLKWISLFFWYILSCFYLRVNKSCLTQINFGLKYVSNWIEKFFFKFILFWSCFFGFQHHSHKWWKWQANFNIFLHQIYIEFLFN